MVPLTIFRSRSFTGANLLTLFLYAAVGIFFFLFPLNLIQVQGYSASTTGAAVLPLILLMFVLSRWSGGLVAHYGPRGPLIIGPLIASFGFVLFAMPSVGDSYWKAFFAAVVVLGLGIAVTVPSLTTVVMSSVDQNRVGTASGINNAVARVAGVLAIAALGIAMVTAFGSRLNNSLAHLSLSPAILQELQKDEIRLAGLQVPAGLNLSTKTAIREAIKEAFVFGFRIVMLICAGLSLASAAAAWLLIRDPDRLGPAAPNPWRRKLPLLASRCVRWNPAGCGRHDAIADNMTLSGLVGRYGRQPSFRSWNSQTIFAAQVYNRKMRRPLGSQPDD
jgi:MFS family permease